MQDIVITQYHAVAETECGVLPLLVILDEYRVAHAIGQSQHRADGNFDNVGLQALRGKPCTEPDDVAATRIGNNIQAIAVPK